MTSIPYHWYRIEYLNILARPACTCGIYWDLRLEMGNPRIAREQGTKVR